MSTETEQQVVINEAEQVISQQEETTFEQQSSGLPRDDAEVKVIAEDDANNSDSDGFEDPKSCEDIQPEGEATAKEGEEVEQEQEQVVEESDSKKHFKDAIAAAEKLYEEFIDQEIWNLDSDKDGIQGYSRTDVASGLKMARGEGIIYKPADTVSRSILEPASILKWEGNLVLHEVVEKHDEFEVIRSLDKKRPLVSQRETLLLVKTEYKDDGSIVIIQRSFAHEDYPEKKEYVRAYVNMCSWTLTPDAEDPNITHGTYIIFVDPKGWVPKPVFNAFVSDQASNIKKLRNYVEKL